MAKKSWLEKMGLVESKEQGIDSFLENYESETISNDFTSAEVESVATFDLGDEDFLLVEEVYEKSNLSDLTKSIFKVDEFSKVLPDSLPTDAKRQSVIGILSASNLQVYTLVEDAEQRIEALNAVKSTTNKNTADIIAANEIKINELLEQIDNLKHENNDRKNSQEKQDEILVEEINRIEEIKKFIIS